MASTASPLKQASDLGREAEEAAANGSFEEAAQKYLLASQYFLEAAKHTNDPQMVQSLNLLAQTHKNRAEELQVYLDAAQTLQGADSYYAGYGGKSMAYSTQYESDDDEEDNPHPGAYWEGEDMIYARSSSPFGGSDPLLFVFTKAGEGSPTMAESQFYEIHRRDNSGDPTSSTTMPASVSSSSTFAPGGVISEDADGELDSEEEMMTTWQRMLLGMEKLLDILPRSTIPFSTSASPSERRNTTNETSSSDDTNVRSSIVQPQTRTPPSSVTESFILVPSQAGQLAAAPKAAETSTSLKGSILDYAGLSKEELLREINRLVQAVEYLRSENAALLKTQEERRETKRENDMLKESILRFRQEFEKQTHQLQQNKPASLSRSIVGNTKRNSTPNTLARSALSQTRPVKHPHHHGPSSAANLLGRAGGASGRSLSSSTQYAARPGLGSPPSSTSDTHSSALMSSVGSTSAQHSTSSVHSPTITPPNSGSCPADSSTSSSAIMTSSPPLSASMFWIQNIQMKRLKELEERNRSLTKQLKKLKREQANMAMITDLEKKVTALEEENKRQRETIEKYDEKWKRLERSAREKMKQRQTASLSRAASSPAPVPPQTASGDMAAIPSSLSEGAGGLSTMLAIPALAPSPSSSYSPISPVSSPVSSSPPLSSSPSSSFLMHAVTSSLLSSSSTTSSSLFPSLHDNPSPRNGQS